MERNRAAEIERSQTGFNKMFSNLEKGNPALCSVKEVSVKSDSDLNLPGITLVYLALITIGEFAGSYTSSRQPQPRAT
jgi:hypothetical protein